MTDDDLRALMALLGCCCCHECEEAERQQRPRPHGGPPLARHRRPAPLEMPRSRPSPPADEGFVVMPAGHSTAHMAALLGESHPRAAFVPRENGEWGPVTPAPPPNVQEWPPRVLLPPSVSSRRFVLPPGMARAIPLEWLREAERGPTLPYAVGIRNGRRYARQFDLPAWTEGAWLRHHPGNTWPDDGTHVWAGEGNIPKLYQDNPAVTFFAGGTQVDFDSPYMVFGRQGQLTSGQLLWNFLNSDVDASVLPLGPFRAAYAAELIPVAASVRRLYEDGNWENETTADTADIVLSAPSGAVSARLAWSLWNYFLNSYTSVGHDAGMVDFFLTPGVWRDLDGEPERGFRLRIGGVERGTPELPPADRDPPDRLTGMAYVEPEIEAYVTVPVIDETLERQNYERSSEMLPRKLRTRVLLRPDGTFALSEDEKAEAAARGRVIYEGPLGTLPAPYSGLSREWCGLTITATGAFTADAWTEGREVWACVAHASGLVQLSRRRGERWRVWSGSAADLGPEVAAALTEARLLWGEEPQTPPQFIPVPGYDFLHEGQGWPRPGGGTLVWQGGTVDGVYREAAALLVTVRSRRRGDPRPPGALPVTARPVPVPVPPRRLRLVTATPPESCTPAEHLTAWRRDPPGTGTPALRVVSGLFRLTFPALGATPMTAGITALTFLTTKEAARELARRLTVPPDWRVEAQANPGPHALVVLRRDIAPHLRGPPAGVTVELRGDRLPIAHPRAHLHAAHPEVTT